MLNLTRQKNNSGFTLVEVLVATTILIMVVGIMYGIYSAGQDIWEAARYQADLQAQARRAMDFMVSELRNTTRTSTQNPSPNISIPSKPNNKELFFYLPEYDEINARPVLNANGNMKWATNNQIKYQYIPGQRELRRLEKGQHRILARDVSNVEFIDRSIDSSLFINEVNIILTLNKTTPRQKNISVTLTSTVRLRN